MGKPYSFPRQIWSVGQIAKELYEDVWRIEYAIRSRRIPSSGLVGNCRLFERSALDQIKIALREMDAYRRGPRRRRGE